MGIYNFLLTEYTPSNNFNHLFCIITYFFVLLAYIGTLAAWKLESHLATHNHLSTVCVCMLVCLLFWQSLQFFWIKKKNLLIMKWINTDKNWIDKKKKRLFSVGYLLISLAHDTRKKNFHLPVVVLKSKCGVWRQIGEKSELKLRNW